MNCTRLIRRLRLNFYRDKNPLPLLDGILWLSIALLGEGLLAKLLSAGDANLVGLSIGVLRS